MGLPTFRQALGALIVIFIVYAILTSPAESANVTGNAWDQIKDGFEALTIFFDGLIGS